jgi:hypothetical protein
MLAESAQTGGLFFSLKSLKATMTDYINFRTQIHTSTRKYGGSTPQFLVTSPGRPFSPLQSRFSKNILKLQIDASEFSKIPIHVALTQFVVPGVLIIPSPLVHSSDTSRYSPNKGTKRSSSLCHLINTTWLRYV